MLEQVLFKPQMAEARPLSTGIDRLDDIMSIGSGIITIRSTNKRWLFSLMAGMMVRNHVPGKKTICLHWVDYYKRCWTMDFDFISGVAKRAGLNAEEISKSIYFVRAFSANSVESDENWNKLFNFAKDVNFLILDSASELYDDRPKYTKKTKSMLYALGMFSRLCMKTGCIGIVLDDPRKPIHPYLGSLSSIILQLDVQEGIVAKIEKHPMMEEQTTRITSWGQQNLGRWVS